MSWSHFAHGADIGLRGTGADKARAFAAVAEALTAVVTDPENVAARETIEICCSAPSDEDLLVDWLNALIYEMAVGRMLFRRFDVAIENGELHAKIQGEPVDRERHAPAVEVKGATYTALTVKECDDGWLAQCVVDV